MIQLARPLLFVCASVALSHAQPATSSDSFFVRQHYVKLDRPIPMRDCTKLYTVLYVPTDAAPTNQYPILMERTPYSAGRYSEANYSKSGPGMSKKPSEEKYIFVYQDGRGRYRSEGNFEEMTPSRNRAVESPKKLTKAYYGGSRPSSVELPVLAS